MIEGLYINVSRRSYVKILRVNMKETGVRWEPVPAEYEQLGGRALIAKLLLSEIPPDCDALGPHNKPPAPAWIAR